MSDIHLRCPSCKRESTVPSNGTTPHINCGDCLMERIEVVELVPIFEEDPTFTIPPFLQRPMTPEIAARLKRITVQYRNPKIKNPPKRSRRRASGLGAAFGSKITAR